ncbi:MAG: Nramp family divalent metal transporter [Candidatus Bathyarchaeia archaeon]
MEAKKTITSMGEEYEVREIPPPPSGWDTLRGKVRWIGPGFIVSGLEVGTGELIVCSIAGAMYGAAFAWTILLSAIIKVTNNYLWAKYTIATGESPMRLFARIRPFLWLVWLYMFSVVISDAWFFSGCSSSAGTSLFELTKAGSYMLWGYVIAIIAVIVLAGPKVIYNVVEKIVTVTSLMLTAGMIGVVIATGARYPEAVGEFIRGMFSFGYIPPKPGALAFMVTMFGWAFGGGQLEMTRYAIYAREKGYAMGQYIAHLTGLRAKPEEIPVKGFMPSTSSESLKNFKAWLSLLKTDMIYVYTPLALFGSLGYMFSGMTILKPLGLVPAGIKTAVEQARYFGEYVGPWGFALFLFLAAINLWDTYLAVMDGNSRVMAEGMWQAIPAVRRRPQRDWYYMWVAIFTICAFVLAFVASPAVLVQTGSTLGAAFMFITMISVLYVTYKGLPKEYWPHPIHTIILIGGIAFYIFLTGTVIAGFFGIKL